MRAQRFTNAAPTPTVDPTWETLLGAPTPGAHVAQLFTRSALLVEAVSRYAGEGLRRGEAVVLVTRPVRGQVVRHNLERAGHAIGALARRGQLTFLDAADTLADVLESGMPAAGRFEATIGGAVTRAKSAGYRTVRAFGEMVDVLHRSNESATLRLESLWSNLLARHGIALVCGYSLDAFDPKIYGGLLQRVASAHSHLVPVENCARLEHAVQRAYADVFGAGQDGRYLRRAFLAHYARPAAMPDAEAALLAAREFVPDAAAAALLDRARHHYRTGAVPVADRPPARPIRSDDRAAPGPA
jgi:MEDS: MEthanogen/methylotroph, DcmR Sensory domain